MSSIVFPLITLPYVSRILQPSGFGKVDFANSIIAIFMMLSSLGIPTYGIRLVAQCKNDVEQLSKNVKQLLLLQIIGIIICYIFFYICLFINAKMANEKLLFIVLSISILMNGIGIDWFFSGLEEYGYITIRNGVLQIVSVCLILIFVNKPSDYVLYAAITVLSSVGANVLNLFYLRKRIDFRCKAQINLWPHIKGSIVFFLLILAGTALTKLESIMIGALLSYKDVGIYAAANKIIQCVILVFSGVGMTFLPTLISLMKTNQSEFNKLLDRSISLMYLVTVPTCIVLYTLAPQIVDFVFGGKFQSSITPFRILVFIIFVTTVNVVIGNQILIASHKEKYAAIPLLAGVVLSPLLNYILIPLYGVNGAAATLLTTSLVSAIIQLCLVKKIHDFKLLSPNHYKYVFSSIVMLVIVLCLNYLHVLILVNILTAILCYIIMLYIMRDYFVLSILRKIRNI
jgi:O-antigen/teichoic acid export membrane protein